MIFSHLFLEKKTKISRINSISRYPWAGEKKYRLIFPKIRYIQTYCCMQTTIHTYIKLKGLAKKNIFIINCASVFNILYSPYKAHLPSDPRMKWWMSRPDDRRGTWQLFSITPLGVTNFIWTTCKEIKGSIITLQLIHNLY